LIQFLERYYLTAMSYVEGNPLRAHLVGSCKDWRCSSVQERLGYGRGIIEEGPVDLPQDWIRKIDEPLPADIVKEIRRLARKH
jgi:hypothetical protein